MRPPVLEFSNHRAKVQKAFHNLMRGRTALSDCAPAGDKHNADLILVFQQGRIVERGTYEALAKGDGLFARLVAAQSEALRVRR